MTAVAQIFLVCVSFSLPCDGLRSIINMGSYLLLDQSSSGFQSHCQFALSVLYGCAS